jgi:hypothetical protein
MFDFINSGIIRTAVESVNTYHRRGINKGRHRRDLGSVWPNSK